MNSMTLQEQPARTDPLRPGAAATGEELPTLRIAAELNGPRHHANGGFASGTFASVVAGTSEVRLLRKIPLERALRPVRTADGGFEIWDRSARIAWVRPRAAFRHHPPVRPTAQQAQAAREAHPFRGIRHALSDCVVCGPDRLDGLRVTPGPLAAEPDVLASPFVVQASYARAGLASQESLWAALDCVSFPASLIPTQTLAWLGSQSVTVHRTPSVGERLVAVGWTSGAGNRSHSTAAALIDESGSVVASSKAVWVEARHQRWLRWVGRFR
jgi:hypothetical protein